MELILNLLFSLLATTPFVLMMYVFFSAHHYKDYLVKKPIIYVGMGLVLTLYPVFIILLFGFLSSKVVLGQSISDGVEVVLMSAGMSLFLFIPLSILFILFGISRFFTRGKTVTHVTVFKVVASYFAFLLLLQVLVVFSTYLFSVFK